MVVRDPDEGIKKLVEQWQQDVVCFPSWEELLELEYVRRFGDINMFTDDVTQFCVTRGLANAAGWLQRLKSAGVMPTQVFTAAVRHFEKTKGEVGSWFTEEILRTLMQVQSNSH
jgi:hypothetical protein